MTAKRLMQSFNDWRQTGDPMVLASVYETEGSTYSKAGAQMLINGSGDFQGMLSGGCLEGDLAERARAVIESGQAQTVSYDLGQDGDDELWGLGVGCDGLMRIFLMPLTAANNYQPFAAISGVLSGDVREVLAMAMEFCDDDVNAGMSLVTCGDNVAWTDIPDPVLPWLLDQSRSIRNSGRTRFSGSQAGDASKRILFTVLDPPPRILILGGGLDAQPVVRFASELGWRVTVQDHRPAYIEKGDFAAADRVLSLPPEELAGQVELENYAAAVVMSHHLTTDRYYLRLLAGTAMRYVGLLGPPHRRERLLQEIGAEGQSLHGRLRGPAGLDIGGSGPASIALSIVAEMHAALNRMEGGTDQA
jgi:xanthine/CO dehydrogenase XdhC/CoxF family maturation factor